MRNRHAGSRAAQSAAAAAVLVVLGVATTSPGLAHKPITSPYSYNEHVFPILRDHCGGCHRDGGVAPMSLLTYEDTVPWGESIRLELLAGHMPPWGVDDAPSRLAGPGALSPREMDVVLTWATGGTPAGDPASAPAPPGAVRAWPLGEPDLALRLPVEHVVPAGTSEDDALFVVPTGSTRRRFLRAIDLQPGTAAMVRSATIDVRDRATAQDRTFAERRLAVWVPGDEPVALPAGTGFELPGDADLLVRVHYKKTWQHERTEMRDRSTIGLYFTPEPAATLRSLRLAASRPARQAGSTSFSRTITEDLQVISLYPDAGLADVYVTVSAFGLDGSRRRLVAFRPHAGWTRRYWFTEPALVTRGTRIEVSVAPDARGALVPLSVRQAAGGTVAPALTLNVVPAR